MTLRATGLAVLLMLACGTNAEAFNGNILGLPAQGNLLYQDPTGGINRGMQTPAPSDANDTGNSNFSHGVAPAPESGPSNSGASNFGAGASSAVPLPDASPTPAPAEQRSRMVLQSPRDASARRLLFAVAARIDEDAIRPYDRVLLTADVSDEAAAAAVQLLQFDRITAAYRNEKPTGHPADWWEHRAVLAAVVFQETIDLPNRAAAISESAAAADMFASGAARVHAMTAEFMRLAATNVPTGCEKTRDELVRFGETVNVLLDAENTFIAMTRTQPQLSMQSIPGQNAMGAIRGVMNQQSSASEAATACTKSTDTIAIFQLQQALGAMRVIGGAKTT